MQKKKFITPSNNRATTNAAIICESFSENGKTKTGPKKVSDPMGTFTMFIRSNRWYDSRIPLSAELQITIGTEIARK